MKTWVVERKKNDPVERKKERKKIDSVKRKKEDF